MLCILWLASLVHATVEIYATYESIDSAHFIRFDVTREAKINNEASQ